MNTKKVENEKVTIKQVDYENFSQVTTAGDVVEIIRNQILAHHVRSIDPGTSEEQAKRDCNKRHGLEMLLDAIILTDKKMEAWQEMKGPQAMDEREFKMLANPGVYFHDNQPDPGNFNDRNCPGCGNWRVECDCSSVEA